eukprot:NODE_1927_length_807_cov_618.742744_g1526_i0.p1 GENE.NODE_1927_length_807_cov_618.742744_g1526_i0~~NODE_1927_length_807_cov_618.742744_g1526_i0.p1  ORF type:complete len:182 (+),score=15.37 NODE_1927_length_807_cov_618.742744_g1526_i0:82-627(+)
MQHSYASHTPAYGAYANHPYQQAPENPYAYGGNSAYPHYRNIQPTTYTQYGGYSSSLTSRRKPGVPKRKPKRPYQPPKWVHPSIQAGAAIYVAHPEKWPTVAPSGAGLRRSHAHLHSSTYHKPSQTSSGTYQASIEPPAHTMPGWAAPVGLPPGQILANSHKYGIQPIQPFITPQSMPQAF